MGATTYRIMAEFAAQGEPGTESLNAAQKYIVSSTLTDPLGWPNTTIIDGDLHQSVARLKESGATLRTMGSLSLCRSLLVAGPADRFDVVVFPVITGATGRDNIYRGSPDVMLELLQTLDGRLQLLEYRPTVLDGPPGT
ncbi:dihydrofolate reductase family protein [Tessaracoccus flavescens]|uniref:dihydrofolate reductase family protein n=1 Tax=Tessaracoccus flavescens TaxID=399497 RepID=UPI001930F531|nr:dihydrofolate reductase family protein [Tessaracoccus flavescens]